MRFASFPLFSSTELCKGLVKLAAQIEVLLSNGVAPSTTMASSPLKIEGTAAAVKQESTEVIASEQEPRINGPEIIPVALEGESRKPMNLPEAQESLRIEPVIIEEQAEQVETVTYEIFNHGGKRGCARLIDSNGYTYFKQKTRWACTNVGKPCKASVIQRGAVFLLGKHKHNHDPKMGKVTAQRIKALVRDKAHCNLLRPVSAIVDEVSKFARNYFFCLAFFLDY